MPPAQRLGDPNDAGGVIDSIPQSTVFANGLPMSVDGSTGTSHPTCPINPIHCAGNWTTANGCATVLIGGIPVNHDGNADTCGDVRVAGSGNVNVCGAGAPGTGGTGAPPPPEPDPDVGASPDFVISPELQQRIDDVALNQRENFRIQRALEQANDETGLDWFPVRDPDDGQLYIATNDFLRNPDGTYERASYNSALEAARTAGGENSLPPTGTLIDAIHDAANIRNPMVPVGTPGITPDAVLEQRSNDVIAGFGINPGQGDVVSGHLKVIGAGNELYHGTRPGNPNDTWQRNFVNQHGVDYDDYSQGIRLVREVN